MINLCSSRGECYSADVSERHGALLAIAEIILAHKHYIKQQQSSAPAIDISI